MTEPRDDALDARLRALGDGGPDPSLAPVAAVRARGDRRRARGRAALSGATAAVLLLSAGGGYALLSRNAGPEVLQQATPAPSPSPTATPSPRSSQAAPVDRDLLLDAGDAARVLGGDWIVADDREDRYSTYYGCPGREVPAADAGVARTLDGPGERAAGQTLLRHADAGTARAQLEAFVEDLSACPDRPVDSDDGTERYRALDLPGSGADRVYAERTYAPSCDGCESVTTLLAVAVAGPYLSYVGVDATDRAELPALADAAEARLQAGGDQPVTAPPTTPPAATETAPERAPTASPRPATSPPATEAPAPVPASRLLLTTRDADAVEDGQWVRESADVEGPLLDPCPGGTRYPRHAEWEDSAATVLTARREAAGTTAVQVVARYPSAAVARDAADGYERAVRGCPVRPDDSGPEGSEQRHEVVEGSADVGGARTLYVRESSSCPGCVSGQQYYAVQQRGDVVSVLLVARGEDGDPGLDSVRPFARAAARKLG